MMNNFLETELKLGPGLYPGRIIADIAKRFKFREIVLDDIDRNEDSDVLRARVVNLAEGIDAEVEVMEDATPQGYPAVLCKYTGPVIGFSNRKRQIIRAELSAYVIQGVCKGRILRKIERHGYTPEWWPFEDSY
ncbi:MAG: hypothetical protein ABH840_01210 [Nanoarchaeota archaeon]